MLKDQDLVVLCKLAGRDDPWTIATIGQELALAPSAIHRSLGRAGAAHLWDGQSRRVNVRALEELLVHAVRYLAPARMHGPARGIPTAWSAPPLLDALGDGEVEPLVWAHPEGGSRGIAMEPLHPSVPGAALHDPVLYQRLALIDALRAGGPRVRREAANALRQALGAPIAG